MTRELLLRTSLAQQLTGASGWSVLDEPLALRAAASDLPGFHLSLDTATYTTYDSAGHPLAGTQVVTIRMYYAHDQMAAEHALETRASTIDFIEHFFRGIYVLPTPVPGDTAQLDSVRLTSIEPSSDTRAQTRSVVTARVMAYFTLL